jgi:hypothetical protein
MTRDRMADGTHTEGAMVDAQLRSASILNELSSGSRFGENRKMLIASKQNGSE